MNNRGWIFTGLIGVSFATSFAVAQLGEVPVGMVARGPLSGGSEVSFRHMASVAALDEPGTTNIVEWADSVDSFETTAEAEVCHSSFAVEITVESVDTPLFNTPNGTAPPGSIDDYEDDSPWSIGRLAVATIDNLLLGPAGSEALVTLMPGGIITGPTGTVYKHTVTGLDVLSLATGERAMVFGQTVYTGTVPSDAAPCEIRAFQKVGELGQGALYVSVSSVYMYDTPEPGLAASTVNRITRAIDDLRTGTAAALAACLQEP